MNTQHAHGPRATLPAGSLCSCNCLSRQSRRHCRAGGALMALADETVPAAPPASQGGGTGNAARRETHPAHAALAGRTARIAHMRRERWRLQLSLRVQADAGKGVGGGDRLGMRHLAGARVALVGCAEVGLAGGAAARTSPRRREVAGCFRGRLLQCRAGGCGLCAGAGR